MSDAIELIERITFPTSYTLADFDTSAWLLDDKEWVAKRKADWSIYEPVLKRLFKTKGLAVCKRYYLKGQLPDENAWKTKDEAHSITVFNLLWLHPSHDFDVLLKARNAYLNSGLVTMEGIQWGYNGLMDTLFTAAALKKPNFGEIPHPDTRGHAELYFRVLMHGLDDDWYPLGRANRAWLERGRGSKFFSVRPEIIFFKPKVRLSNIFSPIKWLNLDSSEREPLNEDYLLLKNVGMDFFYRCIHEDVGTYDYLYSSPHGFWSICSVLKYINDFDVEHETDVLKVKLVNDLRDILDNRPWMAPIKEIWLSIRAGTFELGEKPKP